MPTRGVGKCFKYVFAHRGRVDQMGNRISEDSYRAYLLLLVTDKVELTIPVDCLEVEQLSIVNTIYME